MATSEDLEKYEIYTESLTKIYGKGKDQFKAVDSIDLKVEPGIHGFLGPNGAGKTTTINMLIGGLSVTEGKAYVRGKEAGTVDAKQLIGFLPQDPTFYDNMTGLEYLQYIGKLSGLSSLDVNKKSIELLEYFDIWEFHDRKIDNYSGGMKQKIGIAASLIHDPKILILDEPTANLDPIGRQNIIDRIKELSDHMSVFVSSHILAEIEQMCGQKGMVTMIDRGKIAVSDTIERIKKNYLGNTYMLNSNKNIELLEILETDENISKCWLSDDEGEPLIHMIPEDPLKLQKKIPSLITENDAILYSFKQPEISLQDIFVVVMSQNREDKE